MRLVFGSLQMPTTQNNRGVISYRRYFEIRKCQRAHLFAGVVVFLVTIEHGLPAAVTLSPETKMVPSERV